MIKKILVASTALVLGTSTVVYAASAPTVFPNGIESGSAIKSTDGTTQAILTPNVANGFAPLDSNAMMSAPVSGDVSSSTAKASGSSIYNKLQDTIPLMSNLRAYTYGDGTTADASLLENYVAANCGQTVNVPSGYILPINSSGGAYFPDTSTCTQHYTWEYNTHPHTTGGTETDFRTPDDLHINTQNGMISLAKTKLNTATADPYLMYLQFINENTAVGPVSSSDTTRQSLEAVELNMQATAGSTGSLNGFQCDMTDNSTTGDNANVCAPSNVFKYSDVGKDWGISIAGYDYSATQPQNTISYTGIENDVQVSGQDMGASLWDSTEGGRHLMWLGANTVQYPSWAAGHAYSVGDKIVDANKNWVWIVTTAGTSSTGSDPTGSWEPATGSYTDGTVVFTAKIDYHGVVSKAIYVINDHVDDNYSYFDDVLGVNANVRDSSINLTNEILTQSDGASIRLAKGHPIDFSGDATVAGKNQITTQAQDDVTVGYETYPAATYGTGLTYNLKSVPTLAMFSSDHSIRGLGIASFAIGDNGSLAGVTQAARAGITFGHSKYSTRQTDAIYGSNGLEFTSTNSTGGINSHPTFELPATSYADGGTDTIDMDNPVRLLNLTKTQILALTPATGTIVNDTTDNVPVVYENGSWYPITLGSALSD